MALDHVPHSDFGNHNPLDIQPKVLVVDDEVEAAEEIKDYLLQAGFACLETYSMPNALKAIDNNPSIRLALIDIKMPGGDGISLMKRLAAATTGDKLGVILFSGHAREDDVVAALRGRALDFLRKPIDPKELVVSVRKALKTVEQKPSATFSAAYSEATALAREFLKKLGELIEDKTLSEEAMSGGSVTGAAGRGVKLLRRSYQKQKLFRPLKLKIDPGLLMLFELYDPSNVEGIAVTNLCISGNAAQTTALRRIQDLERAGLIERSDDKGDRRRAILRLTKKGADAVESYAREVFSPTAG